MAKRTAVRGKMTVAEAGRKGGETVRDTYGHEFYEEIGKKGGRVGGPRVKRLIEEGKKATRR